MMLCDHLEVPCGRCLWSTVPASTFMAIILVFSLPIPIPRRLSMLIKNIREPFIPALTLSETEELEHRYVTKAAIITNGASPGLTDNSVAPRWRTSLFSYLALTEVAMWFIMTILVLADVTHHQDHHWWVATQPFLIMTTWAFVFARVLHVPPVTPPFDLLILAIFHLIGSILALGGQLYSSWTWDAPLPSHSYLAAEFLDLGIITTFLTLIMNLPLNVPSTTIDKNKIGKVVSPEDYTYLSSWITFSWVRPLVEFGANKTLSEEDVWDVSPTLKTRVTFFVYSRTPGTGVFWKLLRANSLDLIVDFFLAEVSVVLEFAGPILLRHILLGLETPQQGSRGRLYLYATLVFLASLLQAQADLQHLWYGRRAASRIGTQLSAAIYDKALRISDQSGVVSSTDFGFETMPGGSGKSDGDGKVGGGKLSSAENDTKDARPVASGADVGKIVNLMGIDCQKAQNLVSTMTDIYTAPLQLVLSCWYLYSVLGVSAFAGFISLVIAVPLSRWLGQVTMKITQGTLAAKDSRMKLVNEMFGAIKFIKLFAWENRWVQRVMEARDVEIKWLRKSRNVNVAYSFLWTLVPNLVPIVSFFVYVYTGHELTVSTAFTAIRLFEMLRYPLGALPYALVTLAQTKVSLDRLNTFFNEGEIPDEVSSLRRAASSQQQEIKLEDATLRWPTGGGSKNQKTKRGDAHGIYGVDSSLTPPGESKSRDRDDAATWSPSTQTVGDLGPASDAPFELKNISLKITPGKLTIVTGPTASGKTTLLLAFLGELDVISGNRSLAKNPTVTDEHGLTNSIAYAAQTPWLQQLSIKENIIFGYPLNQARYDAVVEACALHPDFEMLDDGDLTEIGSKGVSLSGGQKARVALARAVYAPTQFLILDDIFSAVDSHTARTLYDRLFGRPLLAYRTVLLVTHHVDLVLPRTHYIVHMTHGKIEHQGTVDELKVMGLLHYVTHNPISLFDGESGTITDAEIESTVQDDISSPKPKARNLVDEEMRAEGSVKWSVYKAYLKASSYWTWFCVLVGIVAAEFFDVGTRLWIGIWGSAYHHPTAIILRSTSRGTGNEQFVQGEQWPMIHNLTNHNITASLDISTGFPDARLHPFFYVAIYCAIGFAAAVVAMSTQWILFTGGLKGGRALFRNLLISLSIATFRFYDTTPIGRILNRFGKDFDALDGTLPFMMHYTTTALAAFLAAVITVVVVLPWFFPVGAFLAYCYFRLGLDYLATSRDLRRMESTSRSPIMAGFSDLVDGIITVRAFSAERRFLDGHCLRVDKANKFWYFTWMLNRWLRIRFDALGAASVYAATLFVLSGYVPAGLAGLSIVSAMTFSTSVYWMCRGYTDLELCLNSVERVVEYLSVPKEPEQLVESNRVPAYWPSSSKTGPLLVVEDLEVKYAPELPSVLHGISFSLNPNERVGVLGRTGCGKSTLATSLLRFVEPSKGRIIIDEIDIATIGVHDLRSRVTFIAQDQALFLGNVRDNLDPFNEYSDAECLDALSRVQLVHNAASNFQNDSWAPSRTSSLHGESTSGAGSSTVVSGAADHLISISLDTKVSAGGQNFSNGQRQLLAMARALIRQSGVVILDEATSSIDKATDTKIQAVIREQFKHSLLLTIAHRLETIIDYDRIIVLDKGRIVEFDTPYNLIQREGGVFRWMCIHSGFFDELEATAAAHGQGEL